MLSQLYIENLAVIEKASIDLTPELNVFTGETGAGKSILINGINAILGQRTNKDIVRTGANKAVVTAVFEKIPDSCLQLLNDSGISCDDGQLFLERWRQRGTYKQPPCKYLTFETGRQFACEYTRTAR